MPHIIELSDEDRELAKLVAQARCLAKKKWYRFNDSGYHKDREQSEDEKNERWYPHFIGLLGEIAYFRLKKIPLKLDVTERGDNIDCGDTEIKTRLSTDRNPYLLVKKTEFEKKTPRIYALMRLERDLSKAELLGQVSREEFQAKACMLTLYGKEKMALKARELEGFTE